MADPKKIVPAKKPAAKAVETKPVKPAAAAAKAAASALAKVTAKVAPKAPAEAAMKAFEPAVAAAKEVEISAASAIVETARSLAAAAPQAEEIVAPAARLMEAGAARAREAYARAQATGENLRQAVSETARGAFEVNDKVIDALRAQSDATLDLWRSAVTAGSLSEAIRVQATGSRQVYETAASHWKDVAETTSRWFGDSVKPIRSAIEETRRA